MTHKIDWKAVLKKADFKVVYVNGWENRGRPGSFVPPKAVLVHHTAGSANQTSEQAYRFMVNGRTDLAGPLTQLLLNYKTKTLYVIAAGRSNHAGRTKAKKYVQAGDGNTQMVGIEIMNSGYEGWKSSDLAFVHKVVATVQDGLGLPRDAVYAHGETSETGKWDPGYNGRMIDMTAFRAAVAKVKTATNKPAPKGKDYGKMDVRSYTKGGKNDSTLWLKKRVNAHLAGLGIKHSMVVSSRKYGAATVKAVAAFQRAQGWTGSGADGMLGPETLKRLAAAAKTKTKTSKPTPKGKDYGKMDVRSYAKGRKNDSTLWLKKRVNLHLAELGIKHSMVVSNPKYGAGTVRAVAAFQRAQGWTGSGADGMPGPETLKRLAARAKHTPVDTLPKGTTKLRHRHASMQFSDSTRQQSHDVEKIFTQLNADIITGTEAGPGAGELGRLLREGGKKHGYHMYVAPSGTDCWIAIRKSVVKRVVNKSYTKIIPRSSQQKGAISKWGDKGLVRMEVELKTGEFVSVYALHGLTKARTKRMSINAGSPFSHQDWNRKMVRALAKAIKVDYSKSKYAFFGGDFNQLFSAPKANNALFATGLTSAWNMTKKFPNTGHGNIDGVGILKADKRITVSNARVWNDKTFLLHTDHFVVGATWHLRKS